MKVFLVRSFVGALGLVLFLSSGANAQWSESTTGDTVSSVFSVSIPKYSSSRVLLGGTAGYIRDQYTFSANGPYVSFTQDTGITRLDCGEGYSGSENLISTKTIAREWSWIGGPEESASDYDWDWDVEASVGTSASVEIEDEGGYGKSWVAANLTLYISINDAIHTFVGISAVSGAEIQEDMDRYTATCLIEVDDPELDICEGLEWDYEGEDLIASEMTDSSFESSDTTDVTGNIYLVISTYANVNVEEHHDTERNGNACEAYFGVDAILGAPYLP